MTSRFERRFKAQALPLLEREFNQPIKLIDTGDSEVSFQCFLDLDDATTEEGFSDIQGTLSIRTSAVLAKIDAADLGKWNRARIRGQIFDVYAVLPDQFGSTVFSVRRKHDEQKHTNIFDINGEQAVWSS